jgi:hypothetical protein
MGLTGRVLDRTCLFIGRVRVQDAHMPKKPTPSAEKPISLAPLRVGDAIRGLFSVPDPDATKPPKRKKAPPPPKE